jgi:hypothetical protein
MTEKGSFRLTLGDEGHACGVGTTETEVDGTRFIDLKSVHRYKQEAPVDEPRKANQLQANPNTYAPILSTSNVTTPSLNSSYPPPF